MSGPLRDFLAFLGSEKKWWLVPTLVVLAGVGILVAVATCSPSAAPFVYTR